MAKGKLEIDVINNVKKYIEKISKKFDIKEVYIFGSYARGTNDEDSDIDLAVVIGEEFDTIDLMIELMMLTKNIDLRIEPHPIKEKDFEEKYPFIDEIKDTGLKVA